MTDRVDVLVAGSGNAALCAGIAALEAGRSVLLLEKAGAQLGGGNSRYTAGAMRFCYENGGDLLPLLEDPSDARLASTDFGSYVAAQFGEDLLRFNQGRPLSAEQLAVVDGSYAAVRWLGAHGIRFAPNYAHQSSLIDGRHVFWGGLPLQSSGEGVGLIDAEMAIFQRLGGEIRYDTPVLDLLIADGRVIGATTPAGSVVAGAVVLACGGFEASREARERHLGPSWGAARVRGTPHNTGDGLEMALRAGAEPRGSFANCHSSPTDHEGPDFGNLSIPHRRRKLYRKIWYHLGVMVNTAGARFVDEGSDLRNFTYAQVGRAIMAQPDHRAWQIFDAEAVAQLPEDYWFEGAHFVEADDLDGLATALSNLLDARALLRTIHAYNAAVDDRTPFDLSIKDGRGAPGLEPPRLNWARRLATPPFRAYPVTGGVTFTYGGVGVSEDAAVLRQGGDPIPGLYACGEMVGGVFHGGYPGGAGLTSGVVFGRKAGTAAARFAAAAGQT